MNRWEFGMARVSIPIVLLLASAAGVALWATLTPSITPAQTTPDVSPPKPTNGVPTDSVPPKVAPWQPPAPGAKREYPPGLPKSWHGIGMYDRPGGQIMARVFEAWKRGDLDEAAELCQLVIDGEYHLYDRLDAARDLALIQKKRGNLRQAEDQLELALSWFREAAPTMSPSPIDAPLDQPTASKALLIARTLEDMRYARGDAREARGIASNLILEHRSLFESPDVLGALLQRARDLERRHKHVEYLETMTDAVTLDPEGLKSDPRWLSAQEHYAGALVENGRADDAAASLEQLWNDPAVTGDDRLSIGRQLENAARKARMYDRAIDVSWELIDQIDQRTAGVASDPVKSDSLSSLRRSLLNAMTSSQTYGRPMDALRAVGILRSETADPEEIDSLDIAEQSILKSIESGRD
jgi:tetratricopeptide (TPR) repeat protein